ncbi:acyl-CoA carboxylase subunit epsilon [Saccharomonospora piscinae]|uniref:acyl-CoA carboxylase subunit epsilon n=1 Tax=Saccharomonospora piscinae TaxID=687388 RepID=UPI00046449D1|nr:acyl-CoA carboxylase subunit epsilon [Saccharomonospora piscinae]
MTGEASDRTGTAPLLRVERGAPDDEELAALATVVAGLASAASSAAAESPARRSRWSDPASRLRLPSRPGRGAWRWSAYPA